MYGIRIHAKCRLSPTRIATIGLPDSAEFAREMGSSLGSIPVSVQNKNITTYEIMGNLYKCTSLFVKIGIG
jgi:hypothetical protein